MKKLIIIFLTLACLVACKNQVSQSPTGIFNGLKQISYIKYRQIKSTQSEQATIGEALLAGNAQETAI